MGWEEISAVRAEWPQVRLSPDRDLAAWREGVALYQHDDYHSMMRCAELLAPALAHSLYGEGLLRGDDLPETAFKLLYASLEAPPDGKTFADHAQKAARLALTIIRENGWQPPSMGGNNEFFAPLITDKGNRMLLSSAIGPANRPWEGDLKAFFAVPVTRLTPEPPNPTLGRGTRVVNQLHTAMREGEAGDPASAAYFEGVGLQMHGQTQDALEQFSIAANLGHVEAMKSAGDAASELDRRGEARYWFEQAANAGNSHAMYNVAVLHFNAGEHETAATWYQRAAEAGEVDGFAALTQMADVCGEPAAERHWARLGAEAGQDFCMFRHALYLTVDAGGDIPTLRRARDFVEAAAERGNEDAPRLAVAVNMQIGDRAQARKYAEMVIKSGDTVGIDQLKRHGAVADLGLDLSAGGRSTAGLAESGYRCPNPQCIRYGQRISTRQCDSCYHYAQSN